MAWKTWITAAILLRALPFTAASPQSDVSPAAIETFEYVVIGSGPGGGPLAANLARAGHKTLLLEAGDDEEGNLNEAIPAFGGVATQDPTMAWNFFVKHYEDNAQAVKDPKMVYNMTNGTWYVGLDPPPGSNQLGIWYPRAGTLGGCDTHNAGITVYPNRDDWQTVVDLTGDDSWDPDKMRKYFKRIERNLYLPKGTAGHGFSGYLATNVLNKTFVNQDPQLIAIAKGADIALGHSARTSSNDFGKLASLDLNNNDANRDQEEDLWQCPVHMNETVGRSHAGLYVTSVANAAYANGTKKYPLTVRLTSFATKIVFDSTKKATGVEYLQGKSLYRADSRSAGTKGVAMKVAASKEVIVSGGVFNTPQLLKLSGIGPKAELSKFKIPVVADLPGVGSSLQDHYEIAVISQAPAGYNFFENCTFGATPDDPCLAQWKAGTGPYASSAFPEMVTKLSSVSDGVRDIFGFGGPLYFTGFRPGNIAGPVGSFTWGMVKSRAKNKAGTVNLKSADPLDTPLINFNYFKEGGDEDLQGLADAVALARKIFASAPAPGAPQVELYPGSNVTTAEQIKTYIKNEAYSHHGCCTAAIGADNDTLAVLDSAFRVRGVTGLRVVDGSAFPQAPGSFPVLATFLLSEKAADAILADA